MINEFLKYQQSNKGLSAATIAGYSKELKAFVRYAKPMGLTWSNINQEDIESYVAFMHASGLQPRTIKRRVEVLRLIFKWAIHRGLLQKNPAQYVQTPKVHDTNRKAADENAIMNYLREEPQTRQSLITHIIVSIILHTGMRIGEIVQMHGKDIDTNSRHITVFGKGGKYRHVYYPKDLDNYLNMMAVRQGRIFDKTETTYRYMMYREIHTNPHAIRHLFACRQLNRGMSLKTLSCLLGHEHTTTTEIYAKMAGTSLQREYNLYN